jgi:hypothetical protein
MPANPVISEEAGREIASRLEAEHPLWIVVFGVYTQQFVCFPRFQAPAGTMVTAKYPDALPDRMRRVEQALCSTRRKGVPAHSAGQSREISLHNSARTE